MKNRFSSLMSQSWIFILFLTIPISQVIQVKAYANDYLRVYDSKTGHMLWEFNANKPFNGKPIVIDEMTYIRTGDNKLYALDTDTGKKIWQYDDCWSRPVFSDDILYLMDRCKGRLKSVPVSVA